MGKKKKQKHQSEDQSARENNRLSPTQNATLQTGEKYISNTPPTEGETNQTVPHTKSSSSDHATNAHFSSRNPTFEDPQPTSKTLKTLHLDKGKKRKDKEMKASKHGDDDSEKVEPQRAGKHIQDDVFEEKGEKEHAAQVEGKGLFQSTSKSENSGSKSPRKEQKDGLGESKKRVVGSTAGDKEGRSSGSRVTGTRVFSDEDVIVLLQGTINCALSQNVPASSISASVLREFLDGKLHSDFSKSQIYEKIRRLKQKFVKNMMMFENNGGEGPVFLKPHEAMVFELSKKIWGGKIGAHNNTNARDNHVKDQILVKDSGSLDLEGKKKSNKGKNSLAGKFGATEAAAALDALKDGEGHDNNGETRVQNGRDEDDEDLKVSMKKKRLLVGIENVTKKIKLMLELAKLEFDELKE